MMKEADEGEVAIRVILHFPPHSFHQAMIWQTVTAKSEEAIYVQTIWQTVCVLSFDFSFLCLFGFRVNIHLFGYLL